ncbi:DUF2076 domain-containing protein, partial [Acidisphaera rubrifaciens]|uniref:DUF2076 domain-containing protein n=1 Tax=Acidisphaera rubrifaciens TaxID=50715 RepID=UPI0006623507
MTNEERDIIARFIERVSGAQGATGVLPGGQGQGSVPSAGQPSVLPPIDREADQFIGDLFTRYPEARYRLTQTAFVQEHALAQAAARIQALESQLQQTQQALAQAQQQGSQRSGGFLSGLFGGGAAAA